MDSFLNAFTTLMETMISSFIKPPQINLHCVEKLCKRFAICFLFCTCQVSERVKEKNMCTDIAIYNVAFSTRSNNLQSNGK